MLVAESQSAHHIENVEFPIPAGTARFLTLYVINNPVQLSVVCSVFILPVSLTL